MTNHCMACLLIIGLTPASIEESGTPESQIADTSPPLFTYILADGFRGWACVDFGVPDAPALRQAGHGTFVVRVPKGGLQLTSSFPFKMIPPVPTPVPPGAFVEDDGELRPVAEDLWPRRTKGRADTDDPISRYCLFFGTEAEAAVAEDPPWRE